MQVKMKLLFMQKANLALITRKIPVIKMLNALTVKRKVTKQVTVGRKRNSTITIRRK